MTTTKRVEAKTVIALSSVVTAALSLARSLHTVIETSEGMTIAGMLGCHGRQKTAELLTSDEYADHLRENFVACKSDKFTYDVNSHSYVLRINSEALVADEAARKALSYIMGTFMCRPVTVMMDAQDNIRTDRILIATVGRQGLNVRTLSKVAAEDDVATAANLYIPVKCDAPQKYAGFSHNSDHWAASVKSVIRKQLKKGNFDGVDCGKDAVKQLIDALAIWEDDEGPGYVQHLDSTEYLLTASAQQQMQEAVAGLTTDALDLIDHYMLRDCVRIVSQEFSDKAQKKLKNFFKDSDAPVTSMPPALLEMILKQAEMDEDYDGIVCMLGGRQRLKNRVAEFLAASAPIEWPDDDADADFRNVLE